MSYKHIKHFELRTMGGRITWLIFIFLLS
jgi:hypothetical protein